MSKTHAVRKSGPFWQVMRLEVDHWEFVKTLSSKSTADAFARRANSKEMRL